MMCSDLPALLDEWASSLFRELDYRREAANGTRFKVLRAAQTANCQMANCRIAKQHRMCTCTLLMVDLLVDAGVLHAVLTCS